MLGGGGAGGGPNGGKGPVHEHRRRKPACVALHWKLKPPCNVASALLEPHSLVPSVCQPG